MQLTLLEFQVRAVEQAMKTLQRCARDWRSSDPERSAFVLSAPTGAGKTVIATTIIEALLHGSDEFNVEPDRTAVVLWVTKDPALNEQTKRRIEAIADRVPVATLHVIDNNFTGEKLDPGNVYFINTGKLSVTSLLVRKSNSRQTTFWEVLDNTIRDPQRTLYVILDEAHEGMKPPTKDSEKERLTLVRKIIDGANGYAAAPIVFGLSATPERFQTAMEQTKERTIRPAVIVPPAEVQKSGLLKSSLQMLFPDEQGDFSTVLIREAAVELAHVTTRWADYCAAEHVEKTVRPLMVVQIPNRDGDNTDPEDKLLKRVVDTVRDHLPEFDIRQVGHVLGDRDTIHLGGYTIPKVQPELVQDDPDLRVLIAKDAVSTGWDCPRAEVLVSLRPAKDRTYITQLLGRMVRTPLARSTSDEHLNSASVYLPFFDRKAARQVADDIMGKGSGGAIVGPTVMQKPVDLTWNPNVPQDLKGALVELPSLPKPTASPRPVKRMLAMASLLAGYGLADRPDESSVARLCGRIDGFIAEFAGQVDALSAKIRTADLTRQTVDLTDGMISDAAVTSQADAAAVDDSLRTVVRQLTPKVVNGWLRARFSKAAAADPDFDQDAIKATIAALPFVDAGKDDSILKRVEKTANDQVDEWFDAIRALLPTLGEEARDKFERIRAQAGTPQETSIQLPSTLRVDSVDADGNPLPTRPLHVFADSNGLMPVRSASSWETEVVERELARPNILGWYRNPSAGAAALQIAYQGAGDVWKSVQPDFIVFEGNADGSVGCSIVDPHGSHLKDALPKLHALARYAERYQGRFNRIDAVAKPDASGPLKVLELHRPDVRAAVLEGTDAEQLFASPLARPY